MDYYTTLTTFEDLVIEYEITNEVNTNIYNIIQ